MTKKQFIEMYCKNSKMTLEEYNKRYISLKCDFSGGLCKGCATLIKDEHVIKTHKKLHQ